MTDTSTNDQGRRFVPGELVDVTIRGARVVAEPAGIIPDPSSLHVELGPGWHWIVDTQRAEVTRRAPVEWPPQPADVWRDKDGDAWVALGDFEGGVVMARVADRIGAIWSEPDEVLDSFGPMRLEYRPGWTPTPRAAASEPVEVDKRAEVIAGLRALADLLEQRPDLPTRLYRVGFGVGREGIQPWADALGVQQTANPHNDTVQWWSDGVLRGLEIHAYWIDDNPKPEPVVVPVVMPDVQSVDPSGAGDAVFPLDEWPQPADDEQRDDRCTGWMVQGGDDHQHACELYGDDHTGDHICICGVTWNIPLDENPVPAQRETAE